MEIKKIGEAAKMFFKEIVGKPATVIGVEKVEEGWEVSLEVIDDTGAGFDPILGLYEVTLNEKMEVISYDRKSLRRRSDLEWRAPVIR
ncbi:MAG: gas vesicle protein [archaeon]|nr:gas vesicle protein [archaeon]MCP8313028.1 gas vesicle protein [archaeon]MCP8317442.1 gas vesicle protein [archaeon]MCP8320006.1 gas vesicle protein [archaeon]